MTRITPNSARDYVHAIELPPFQRELAPKSNAIDFDALKNQATVVASEVVSFVQGISVDRRHDIVNAALLAQLAANKKVASRDDVLGWYHVYFDVLEHIGWVLQDSSFDSYEEQADGLEAHEAILKVASVVLGAAPTALAVVKATIEAMKSMDDYNPWITIFNRESRSASTAKFQITLADQDDSGQFMVTTMAFSLQAASNITQVLFFKIWKNKMSLKHCSGKVTIDQDVLASVREEIKKKLAGHTAGYIAAIDL